MDFGEREQDAVVQSVPGEVRHGRFEHTTAGHQIEDAVIEEWERAGLPLRRASVDEDEVGSLRTGGRGYDVLLAGLAVDLTTSVKKYEASLKENHSGRTAPVGGTVICVKIPLDKKPFAGKPIQDIIDNEDWKRQLAEETLRSLIRSLPPHEAKALMGRLRNSLAAQGRI
jgi:hypothetical protein